METKNNALYGRKTEPHKHWQLYVLLVIPVASPFVQKYFVKDVMIGG